MQYPNIYKVNMATMTLNDSHAYSDINETEFEALDYYAGKLYVAGETKNYRINATTLEVEKTNAKVSPWYPSLFMFYRDGTLYARNSWESSDARFVKINPDTMEHSYIGTHYYPTPRSFLADNSYLYVGCPYYIYKANLSDLEPIIKFDTNYNISPLLNSDGTHLFASYLGKIVKIDLITFIEEGHYSNGYTGIIANDGTYLYFGYYASPNVIVRKIKISTMLDYDLTPCNGGFCGYEYNSIATSCYWDKETSGTLVSALGIGKTTAEMKTKSTFIDWDFNTIWNIIETETYPWLKNKCGEIIKRMMSFIQFQRNSMRKY
jgi:hypothetical protein